MSLVPIEETEVSLDYLFDQYSKMKELVDSEKESTHTSTDMSILTSTSISRCNNCGSESSLIEDRGGGNLVCNECGYVKDILIDNSQEYRGDTTKPDQRRCEYVNPLFPNSQSTIMKPNKYYNANSKLVKMSHWNSMPYAEKNLWKVNKEFQDKADKFGIQESVVKESTMLFNNLYSKMKESEHYKIKRGVTLTGLKAACIYYSCKNNQLTKTPADIAKIMEVESIDVTKGCKLLLEIMKEKQANVKFRAITYKDCIKMYTKKLNLPFNLNNSAIKIVDNAIKKGYLKGNTAMSIAAGSVWYVIMEKGINVKKKDMADKCGVSEVTITKIYKKLKEIEK